MNQKRLIQIGLILVGLVALAALVYQIPAVNQRLSWRVETTRVLIARLLDPVEAAPRPIPQPTNAVTATQLPTFPPTSTPAPTFTPTPGPTSTPTPTATP